MLWNPLTQKHIALIVVACVSYTARSATFTSTGSGSWQTPGTWNVVGFDADGMPDSDDDVTILSGHALQSNGNMTVRNITIESGASLNWNVLSYLYMYGVLTNSGIITQSAGNLRPNIFMYNGSSIQGAGSFSSASSIQCRTGTCTIQSDVTLSLFSPGGLHMLANCTLISYANVAINSNSLISSVPSGVSTAVFENHGFLDINSDNIQNGSIFRSHYPGSSVRMRNQAARLPIAQSGFNNLTLFSNTPDSWQAYQNVVVLGNFWMNNIADVIVNFDGFSFSVGGNVTMFGQAAQNLSQFNLTGNGTQNLTGTNFQINAPTTINAGSNAVLQQASVFNGNLTINGSLDVTASNHNVQIRGNLVNNGNFTTNQNTVTFNGAAAQSISGTSNTEFYNVVLNNANGLTMNSPVLVHRAVNSTSGAYTSNGRLTLNSVSGLDAFIAANVVVNGNITVRRLLAPGPADYRDMCSPVSGATLADWDNEIIISGPNFPDGCAYGNGCFVSVATWNATTQQYVPATSPSNPLTNGVGFEIFIGDDELNFNGLLVDVTGTNNSGNRTLFIRNAWNLVGNPFPSAVDFDLFTRGGGIGNYFYIYDASTRGFEYYDGASGTASGSLSNQGHLASAQGFWVYNTGGTASLGIPQSSKITTTPTFVRKPLPALADAVSLKLSSTANEGYCVSTVDLSAFDAYAAAEDIVLFRGPQHMMRDKVAPILAIVNEEGQMVRKDLRMEADRLEIPLMVNTGVAATYTISGEMIEDFNTYSCVMLLDKKTGKTVNLRNEDYTFTSAGNGQDEVRFVLMLSNENCLTKPVDLLAATEYVSVRNFSNTVTVMVDNHPNMKEGMLTVYNALGQVVIAPQYVAAAPASYELFLPQGEHGVYMVVVDFGDDRVVKKVVY